MQQRVLRNREREKETTYFDKVCFDSFYNILLIFLQRIEVRAL
jgi:hypothetical protein